MSNLARPILVLVIDDDEGIRISLALLLKAKGFDVAIASDGAEGWRAFQDRRPHIVMSDMVMPGHQGLEAIIKIRAADTAVPIIAMSGSIEGGADGFSDRARAAGADFYLSKPFDVTELLDVLALAVKRSS